MLHSIITKPPYLEPVPFTPEQFVDQVEQATAIGRLESIPTNKINLASARHDEIRRCKFTLKGILAQYINDILSGARASENLDESLNCIATQRHWQ
jgi:hypothetical protein